MTLTGAKKIKSVRNKKHKGEKMKTNTSHQQVINAKACQQLQLILAQK